MPSAHANLSRTNVMVKRLSLFAWIPSILFFLWLVYGSIFLGWTSYRHGLSSGYGTYKVVLNETVISEVKGIPLGEFVTLSRWMAFWLSAILLLLTIYAVCTKVSKMSLLEMNIPNDEAVKSFLSSISKRMGWVLFLYGLCFFTLWVTWMVYLKKDAYDPDTYKGERPWEAVVGDTYEGLTLPSGCPDPHVKLGTNLIGNNPNLWPSSSCSTTYSDRITTYFCCFALSEVRKPKEDVILFDFTAFGGAVYLGCITLLGSYFGCSTWWRRRAVGSLV